MFQPIISHHQGNHSSTTQEITAGFISVSYVRSKCDILKILIIINYIAFSILKNLMSGKCFVKCENSKYVILADSEKCFASQIETSVHI
jgi:hypothetical protein